MADGASKTMTPLEWGLLLLLSLFWGGSFFFVGAAVKELPPLTIVALRVSLAALILLLCAPALGVVLPRRHCLALHRCVLPVHLPPTIGRTSALAGVMTRL